LQYATLGFSGRKPGMLIQLSLDRNSVFRSFIGTTGDPEARDAAMVSAIDAAPRRLLPGIRAARSRYC
jgi:hypothetical protein